MANSLTPRLKAFSYHFVDVVALSEFELFTCLAYLIKVNNGFVSLKATKAYLDSIKMKSRRTYSHATLRSAIEVAYLQDVILRDDSRHMERGTIVYSATFKYKTLVDEAAAYWLDNHHIEELCGIIPEPTP